MQEIGRQLAQLFLAAVPTAIIVFLYYFFLRWSFFGPIERILAERRARIEGAQKAAQTSKAAAQDKLRVYKEAIKSARAEQFTEQEAVRRRAVEQRDAVVLAARKAAHDEVLAAKRELEAEVANARVSLEESSAALSQQIADAILTSGPAPQKEAPSA
jgi:F0F1-type ATP synthase membrane subunit b/b'